MTSYHQSGVTLFAVLKEKLELDYSEMSWGRCTRKLPLCFRENKTGHGVFSLALLLRVHFSCWLGVTVWMARAELTSMSFTLTECACLFGWSNQGPQFLKAFASARKFVKAPNYAHKNDICRFASSRKLSRNWPCVCVWRTFLEM